MVQGKQTANLESSLVAGMDQSLNVKDVKLLTAARNVISEVGRHLDINASVELWNGERVPLGREVTGPLAIQIASPGVITSILRRPGLDRIIQHYVHGQLDLIGGTLLDLGEEFSGMRSRKRLKGINRVGLLRELAPFIFARAERPGRPRDFYGNKSGRARRIEENKDFIQFHYDVGNAFYALFLDQNMVYSCGYFTDWGNNIDRAQYDKLDMICRKLRLKPGERMLDIGCGWGALICHAAKNYGVTAHGVTLSQEQHDRTLARIGEMGLEGRVSVEIRDYNHLEGSFDKISSVGMYEHIGLDNIPGYMARVKKLLAPDGLFLNHAIACKTKKKKRRLRPRPEKRALLKYIFPGTELTDIGHTLRSMERAGFEVHDVEGWREHYALTCKIWCQRLKAREAEAIELVGAQTYRMWLAYLASVSLSFSRGSMYIFQVLVSRNRKGPSPVPPTRADLYHPRDV